MTREGIWAEVNEIFRDVFDDPAITVDERTTAADIEDWDSLEHINLIAALEHQFGMKFTMGQVVSMKNVGEMVDIIVNAVG
ncbi:MAG: acyl carrier protein [Lachnospiraceae bacterium]|jgi:acyl carrier protein|nr:acyl carrier protein [Lachnospiraceae bacterium]